MKTNKFNRKQKKYLRDKKNYLLSGLISKKLAFVLRRKGA